METSIDSLFQQSLTTTIIIQKSNLLHSCHQSFYYICKNVFYAKYSNG